MPEICAYLSVGQSLHAQHHQFMERARLECGITIPELRLPLHVIVKRRAPISEMQDELAETLLAESIRNYRLKRITASVLRPTGFSPEGGCSEALSLPIEKAGMELDSVMEDLLKSFEHELSLGRANYEGEAPHVVVARGVRHEDQALLLSLAQSIPWPQTVTVDSLVIAREKEGIWVPGTPIPLLPH